MTLELQIILKLLLAMVLGGIIGWERERIKTPAGLRTHVLVCLGSTLLVSISLLLEKDFPTKFDLTRIAAGIIMGIGFLGAGAIIQAEGHVRGLTTAASVWLVAAIGIALGFGYYLCAVITTVFVLITLVILFQLERHFSKRDEKEESPR